MYVCAIAANGCRRHAPSEADARQIIDGAHGHCISFFDTSDAYSQPRTESVTEQIIGRWSGRGGERMDRTVATKLYGGKGGDRTNCSCPL